MYEPNPTKVKPFYLRMRKHLINTKGNYVASENGFRSVPSEENTSDFAVDDRKLTILYQQKKSEEHNFVGNT